VSGLTTQESVAELRHELRTPLNLIIGYCEMLVEDATDAVRLAALGRTLTAGRDILERINGAVPPSRGEITEEDFAALREGLREPQARIIAATTELLASLDGAPPDPQFERDVRRIRSSAERLLTVELPHQVDRHRLTDIGDHPAVESAAPAPAVAPARILVVDDLEDNRAVLERRLRPQGHEVVCAAGGHAALAMLAREQFDLVLLDVMMPDLDGLAVLERLKAGAATRDIPVIMISALDDVASVVRCVERGADDYLSKPFDPVLLRARIGACLEKKRLRDTELEYLREVGRVIEAATAVEAGRYESGALAHVAQRGDELGRLARVFDGMANQVRARETRLREQVEALKREIGVVRPASRDTAQREPPVLAAGELFANRFEIAEEIGAGGMGTVYRALDRELGEQVALKILRSELVTDAASVERFKREIRLARHISSKHVVRTYDIGERGGVYFLTMEYVHGITVRELLQTRRRLGVASTLAIACQLAYSLAAAHEQGVVHRDIKPENLLLDAAGVLKVMDFGVARPSGGASGLTEVGLLIGTPSYMAPEQLFGEAFDQRADLYAAGVVLFECLTGRLPFEASSPVALIARVLRDPAPAPSSLDPEIPGGVSDLVQRLLAKEPRDRVPSAADLARLLTELG
jgi:DNA-binding response OmpR family regulator